MSEMSEDPKQLEEAEADKPMTFWEHLEELRRRLIHCILALFLGCVVAWEFHGRMLKILETPFANAWHAAGLPGEADLHQAAPAAGFTAYMKLSLIGGAALAAPVIFYELWAFIGTSSRSSRSPRCSSWAAAGSAGAWPCRSRSASS
jgi:sec-independent protein translocase protein TatC